MMQEIETWGCGKCPYSVIIPWEELSPRDYADVLMRIREHRFAHLVSALETANDEDLMRMSGDDDNDNGYEDRQGISQPHSDPVRVDDAVPILEGIEKMLRGARGHGG